MKPFWLDTSAIAASMTKAKITALLLLVMAEIAVMSLWFTSAAVLPDMMTETAISSVRQAALSSGVQLGFVVGALLIAITGLADRFDPRRVFACSAVLGAVANASLLAVPIGGDLAIAARVVVGVAMAGAYPIGMKIAVGWGTKDRGFLVGLLVGALTVGSASPHLVAYLGGTDWRVTVACTSLAAAIGGLLPLAGRLGPHHAKAAKFNFGAVTLAWTNKRIRYAYLGYLGHMFELYVMWAWIGVALVASFALTMPVAEASSLAKLTTFVAIVAGGGACLLAGLLADRIGKAEVTIIAMAVSGLSAVAVGLSLSLGAPIAITVVLVVLWGVSVIPDSAQFSALVADAAPPNVAGSLLTFQTALGFLLTTFTVQIAPLIASDTGWAIVLGALALGPALGILAMLAHRREAVASN